MFDIIDFEEEDDNNKPKYTISDIIDILGFIEEEGDNTKKQEMINNAKIHVSAFEKMLRDFKSRNFDDDGSNKTMKNAESYVHAFKQALRDFTSKDVGGISSTINN